MFLSSLRIKFVMVSLFLPGLSSLLLKFNSVFTACVKQYTFPGVVGGRGGGEGLGDIPHLRNVPVNFKTGSARETKTRPS